MILNCFPSYLVNFFFRNYWIPDSLYRAALYQGELYKLNFITADFLTTFRHNHPYLFTDGLRFQF